MSANLEEEPNCVGSAAEQPGLRPMTALERQQYEDAIWAAQAPEVQQHTGKLVVVHNRRVVTVGTDYDALLKEAAAKEQCPWSELVVESVTEPDFWETPLDDLHMTG